MSSAEVEMNVAANPTAADAEATVLKPAGPSSGDAPAKTVEEPPIEDGAGGDDEDDEEDDGEAGVEVAGTEKKKKKKKPKKKKKAAPTTSAQAMALQSEPPRTPVSTFFKNAVYPVGEIHEYKNDNAWRTTSEEKRHLEKLAMSEPSDSVFNYNSIRRAAEVHRQVRAYAKKTIKPGMTMTEIANMIEDGTRALVEENGMAAGIAFPTGLSRNHIAAHYSPNANDKIVLQHEDVLKVDFGVHVNGRIVDSAFTMNFEPTYNALLQAVKEATEAGIREAGIDVRTTDIGAAVQEVMESYEVEVNGQLKQVKSIKNLTGHSIAPYIIHSGKSVPICAGYEEVDILEEGDYLAIETFGSTGEGYVRDEGDCSHYAKIPDATPVKLSSPISRRVMNTINREFGTLPFCRRYLDRVGEVGYLRALNDLVNHGLVQDYPPLADVEGCMTAQYEHTIILRPTCKEIVTRGDDY